MKFGEVPIGNSLLRQLLSEVKSDIRVWSDMVDRFKSKEANESKKFNPYVLRGRHKKRDKSYNLVY